MSTWAAHVVEDRVNLSETCTDGTHECPGAVVKVRIWYGDAELDAFKAPCDCLCHFYETRAKVVELRGRVA